MNYEALMMICFGISWPISIIKSLKTKIVAGKSPLFMIILCVGYGFGIVHKVMYSYDWLTSMYAVNLLMVIFDLILYFRYAKGSDLGDYITSL